MLKNAEHRGILDGGYRGCREIPLKETTSVGPNLRCSRHEPNHVLVVWSVS